MRRTIVRVSLALAALAVPAAAHAQIHVTPNIGVYFQGNSIEELREGADTIRTSRDGTFALGANLELGSLRVGFNYATDAKINQEGVAGEIGTANLLAVSADLAIRPIPRIFGLQPYGLVGAAMKRSDYSWDADQFNVFNKTDNDFGAHIGVGADFSFGALGLQAEVTDYITSDDAGDWNQHDAFATIGLRVGI